MISVTAAVRSSIRIQRLGALALLVLALGVGGAAIWQVVDLSLGDTTDRAAVARRTIDDYQRAIGRRAVVDKTFQDLQEQLVAWSVLVDGSTPASAVAGVEKQASSIIRSANGEIQSWEAGETAKEGGFLRASVHFEFTLPGSSLATLLSTLESHTPYLFVDRIEVSTNANGEGHTPELGGGAAPSGTAQLSIRLDLHGYAGGQ